MAQTGDKSGVKLHMVIKVEKFDGEYSPDKAPVETVVIEDTKEFNNGTDDSRT